MEHIGVPCEQAEPAKDLATFTNLRHSSQQSAEQLLPDFYCEHITLAMNRERRKQVCYTYFINLKYNTNTHFIGISKITATNPTRY